MASYTLPVSKNIWDFDPTSIAGCTLWLDGADKNTISQSVTQWNDKSGNNNSLVSNSIFRSPGYDSTNKSVTFTAVANSFATVLENVLLTNTITSNSITVIGVYKRIPQSTGTTIFQRLISGSTGTSLDYTTVGSFALTTGDNGNRISYDRSSNSTVGTVNTTNTFIQSTIVNGTGSNIETFLANNQYLRFNGSPLANSTGQTNGSNFNITHIRLGSSAHSSSFANETFNGQISEVLFYNTALTTTQVQDLEGYLAWKWNIVDNLPVSHPYKTTLFSINPTTISGCQLWLDASDVSTLSLTSVTQWNDKSVSANNAIQRSGANMPLNTSTDGIQFIQANQHHLNLLNATSLPTGSNNGTYFFVTKRDLLSTGGGAYFAHGLNGSSLARQFFDRDTHTVGATLTEGISTNGPGTTTFGNTHPTNILPHVTSFNINNFIASGWLNGTPFTSTAQDLQNTINIFNTSSAIGYIGRPLYGGASTYFGGNIYEILVYNSTLSNTDRQIIEGYLAWKWDLQCSLPVSHPYNNNALLSSFNPTHFGASLWYDASDSSSISTNSVFQWNDKSGSNNHVTQNVFNNSPTYVPSSGLTFNGLNNRLSFTNASFITNVNFTFFVVEQRTSVKLPNFFLSGSTTLQNTNLHVGYNLTNVPFVGYYANDHAGGNVGTYTAPITRLWKFNLTTTNRTLYINGTLVNTNTTTTKLISYAGGAIGGGSQGFFRGNLFEMICYTNASANATTFTDDQLIEGYLAWKWGIQNNLPSNHPYRAAGPVSFVPTSLTGCSLWLDSADASSVLTTTAWINKTGLTLSNRSNLTPTSASYEPDPNGTNAIYIADNTKAIQLNQGNSTNFAGSNGQLSFFVVPYSVSLGNSINDINAYARFGLGWTSTTVSAILYQTGSPPVTSGSVPDSVVSGGLIGKRFILGMTSSGFAGSGIVYVNGNPVLNFTPGSTAITSLMPSMYRDASASAGPTYYYEIIGFNTLLSNIQRQQIEGYLALKWGLQSTLPTNHPYRVTNYLNTNVRPLLRNFLPIDIDDCIMWFDGADMTSMFQNTAGTTPVTTNGHRVRLWKDKSGMGNDLTGVSDTNSPTLTTSTNSQKFDIIFNGSNNYLVRSGFVNNSNTYTKIIIFNRNSTTGIGYQRLFSYSTTSEQAHDDPSGFHIQANNSQTNYILYKALGGANFNIATNTYYVATIVATPFTMSLFLNGSSTASATFTIPNNNFSGSSFRLGCSAGFFHFWPGAINEVLAYNRALTISEYQKIEGYLAWKWGFRNSLATNHPFYKYYPPSNPIQPELQLYRKIFDPSDLAPDIWFDPQDRSTIALDTNGRVTQWRNKGTSTRCPFLAIPSYASRSLAISETVSNAIGINGPLLAPSATGANFNSDYMDFSTGSYYVSRATLSGTTMTITLGNPPSLLTVIGGNIAPFSLTTSSGSNTTTLATLYFTFEQMVPPFEVGSSITVSGSVNSGSSLNNTWIVANCTPFYVTFALTGATAGTLSTQATIVSTSLPNVATINYTSSSLKQPIMAGQLVGTISGMTPTGLNGTTPTILRANPSQIQFLTNIASGNISSGGTITPAITPHNIPAGRQITVGFAPESRYSDGTTLTSTHFSIESLNSQVNQFTGRGTAYIVDSVPTPNTLTITVPSGLPNGNLRLVNGRVDYGEILGTNASTTGGVNNSNSLSSTGNTSTSATINFTVVPRFYKNTFEPGETITISGVTNPTTYNGTWYVLSSTSSSVTIQTSTTLANMVSTSGTICRTQYIMPSGCFGIQSISVSGTTATVTYNNMGNSINQAATGQPFKVGHAIYIAGTTASGANSNVFNGNFIVTGQSSDASYIGTVQFTTTASAGTTAGTGIICRGSGGSNGIPGTFSSLSCTINPTNAVITFANQPIVPFRVGQQIMIANTVSTGTNINGIQTVTESTNNSVTFNLVNGTGSITTEGIVSGGTLNVTSGTYSSPNLTLNFSPAILSPFPIGSWVSVYGVVPTVNNGFWQVTGGTTSSVILNAPTGSGPVTNTTGNVSLSLQLSIGTMTPHGLSPGDIVFPLGQSSHFTNGANYPGISPIPYTVIEVPTSYRYTVLPRYNFYTAQNVHGWSTSVGPVYNLENAGLTSFPITGYCLENTRTQSAGGIFNGGVATLMYMSHLYMNSFRISEGPQGTIIATSNVVNGNGANTLGNFMTQYLFSSAPRYYFIRNGNNVGRPPNVDSYYQASQFSMSDTNSFRPITLFTNLTTGNSNDVAAQTAGIAFNGWRLDPAFRNLSTNGQQLIGMSDQSAVITNATWSSGTATLTITMHTSQPYITGNSITVRNVNPSTYNGTYTITGTPTLTSVSYALATTPTGTYVAGTGTVILNTTTSLSTNHLRIGSNTQATNLLGIGAGTNPTHYYNQGIGEIIAFNRILTTEERQLLEGWMAQKYSCQTFLANNQEVSRTRSFFTFASGTGNTGSLGYTGTGPYTYTITYSSTIGTAFMFSTLLTITGCTEVPALNGTWAVTNTNSSNTSVTFISQSILTATNPITLASGTLTGTSIQNTFIHPYRRNPIYVYSSLNLASTYTQGLATWFDAANPSTIGFVSGNFINSWAPVGGVQNMILTASTSPSTTTWNPTYENDSQGRPRVKHTRIAFSITTVSINETNDIRITSSTVPNVDQAISFNSIVSGIPAFNVRYIREVTPLGGSDYNIKLSTFPGSTLVTLTQTASIIVTGNVWSGGTLASSLTTNMAPQLTTQNTNNEFTMVLVFSRDGASGGIGYFINYAGGGNTRLTVQDNRTCDYNLNGSAITTHPITYSSTTLVNNTPYILIYYRRASTSYTRLIGFNTINTVTTTFSSNMTIPAGGVSLRIGAYATLDSQSAQISSGSIYEHMLFKYAITDQSIYQIEGYLAWKWGLQSSLPSTHPYKNIRP